jgi:hypothetical protein
MNRSYRPKAEQPFLSLILIDAFEKEARHPILP